MNFETASLNPHSQFILNNQNTMPALGFGTYKLKGQEAYDAVIHALEAGYTMIDTAHFYDNEQEVGRALADKIAAGELRREDIFVTTKIWNEDQRNNRQEEKFHESLKLLGLDYLDLMLIHWPVAEKYHDTWKILEDKQKAGLVKNIGICNFEHSQLTDLMNTAQVCPQVNQMEHHPYMQDLKTKELCDHLGIVYQAWSPLGRGMELKDPHIAKIAQHHNKSAAQVLLRWHLQSGICAIPKSGNKDRIYENIRLFDFELSREEMKLISSLDKQERVSAKSAPLCFDF